VLVAFLREETRRAGFEHLVLGLSGGVDSAVAAMLAVRAVGAGNVHAFALPARESDPKSLEHARLVATAAELALQVIEIGPAADALIGSIGDSNALRRGNVYARLRMTVLFDQS